MSGSGLDRLTAAMWTLRSVFMTPASNMRLALLMYAILAVVLLLFLVMGILIVMRTEADEIDEEEPRKRQDPPKGESARRPLSTKARIFLAVGSGALLLAAWLAAGYTTSAPDLCKNCHWQASEHAKADRKKDPHAGVDCVRCHEPDGGLGRYTTAVPFRILHIAAMAAGGDNTDEYGDVTSRACSSCHPVSSDGVANRPDRGLRMSHAEPLAASARCTDCHTLERGIVSGHNAGMEPCVRCHDGRVAEAACSTCHDREVSAAVRARTTTFRKPQIREVSCGGCHNEERDCDSCHGLRMPHSSSFKQGAHARAAAVDRWYNGGTSCGKCHTAERNPCGSCHTAMIGKAHGVWMADGHRSATSEACDACHKQYAPLATRDFCKDVCHSPEAVRASPR